MKRSLVFFALLTCFVALGQKKIERPYASGLYPKTTKDIEHMYASVRFYEIKEGDIVASVGAGNGYAEMTIATFVKNVNWTIQDIDTAALRQLPDVRRWYEKLVDRPISGSFVSIVGEEKTTHLLRRHYDKIILANVYHELADRASIMKDIYGALNDTGVVLIHEPMAVKPGELHGGCKLPKLWPTDFVVEMKSFGFELIDKKFTDSHQIVSLYTFRKN
jgi:hypothetical protein